jgi:hypothetical protein
MNEIAIGSIKAFVPPLEPIFTLTASQLHEVIHEALQDKIDSLEAIVARQDEKIAALESTADTQADNQLIQLRLINDLREAAKAHKKPTKTQEKNAKILTALIASEGGKMLTKDARRTMRMDKGTFSRLVDSMQDVQTKPYHTNKRQTLLILKPNSIVDINDQQSSQDLDRT